jgi:hypothetical protein
MFFLKIPLEHCLYRRTSEAKPNLAEPQPEGTELRPNVGEPQSQRLQGHVEANKELLVGTIIKPCSISGSFLDLAFTYPNPRLLLAMMDGAKSLDGKGLLSAKLSQTLCYMLCPLAYSRWGVLKIEQPLTALLVSPKCIYRLTLSKPHDQPFRLHLGIEKTTDVQEMEWVLRKYVKNYICDYNLLKTKAPIRPYFVDPRRWTPMNVLAEFSLAPLRCPHFGFVFRTTGHTINQMAIRYGKRFQTLADDLDVVVKYLSALLTVDHESSLNTISTFLTMEATNLKSYLAGFSAANQRREHGLADSARAAANQILAASGADESTPGPAANSFGSATAFAPGRFPPGVFNIKHPYLGVLRLQESNPLLVMRDVGETLSELLDSQPFRLQWRQSSVIRLAFFRDVGLSALDLVEGMGLCHNDIRPPNIGFRDGAFCIIDFDMSSPTILRQPASAFSPDIDPNGLWGWEEKERLMCYTIAQIALTVFLFSGFSPFTLSAISGATQVWGEARNPRSAIDAAFQQWVDSLDEPARSFVASVRRARGAPPAASTRLFPEAFRDHFVHVLHSMLGSEGALQGPDSDSADSPPRKLPRVHDDSAAIPPRASGDS